MSSWLLVLARAAGFPKPTPASQARRGPRANARQRRIAADKGEEAASEFKCAAPERRSSRWPGSSSGSRCLPTGYPPRTRPRPVSLVAVGNVANAAGDSLWRGVPLLTGRGRLTPTTNLRGGNSPLNPLPLRNAAGSRRQKTRRERVPPEAS